MNVIQEKRKRAIDNARLLAQIKADTNMEAMNHAKEQAADYSAANLARKKSIVRTKQKPLHGNLMQKLNASRKSSSNQAARTRMRDITPVGVKPINSTPGPNGSGLTFVPRQVLHSAGPATALLQLSLAGQTYGNIIDFESSPPLATSPHDIQRAVNAQPDQKPLADTSLLSTKGRAKENSSTIGSSSAKNRFGPNVHKLSEHASGNPHDELFN